MGQEFYETNDVSEKGWQPMQLAPRDGTRVLGLERGDDGQWCDPRIYTFDPRTKEWLFENMTGADYGGEPFKLLLWQPVPETPYAPPPPIVVAT